MSADLPTRFDEGLRARSRSSIGWTVTRFLSDQIFSFVVFVILARLLSRADIGAFAVMAVTAEAFRIIATAGLVQTIARKGEITPAFLDTIYRSQQAFSFLSAILIMALAQPIADWMGAPDIALPLAVKPVRTILTRSDPPSLIAVLVATSRLELVLAVLVSVGLCLS